MLLRDAMPASRIAAISARVKGSGASVSAGASGETLVSMSKRMVSLPDRRTSANNSASVGRRVPSTATWSGNCAA